MLKLLLILVIGVAAGYQIGWQDAQSHDETIVTRTLDRVGGSSRGKYDNDLDSRLDRADKD